MEFASQLAQDKIVDKYLDSMRDGYFVDLGAAEYKRFNNSYYFEKALGWKGIAIEYNPKLSDGWAEHRPNTKHIVTDATKVDYQKLFEEYGMPKMIDYLSIDLEPPELTLQCLYEVLKANYEYKIITFEVDHYRTDTKVPVRDMSRKLFQERGYILVAEIHENKNHVDDVWVHPSIHKEGFTF
jgi:hypothetical protein